MSQSQKILEYVGYKIRKIRQDAGWTLRELSEHLGVSSQQIQKYETGEAKIPLDKLFCIAHIFDIEMNQFYNPTIVEPSNRNKKPTSAHFNVDCDEGLSILVVGNKAKDARLVESVMHEVSPRPMYRFVKDGEEAMDYLKFETSGKEQHLPSLILMDTSLERRSSEEILKWLKHHPNFSMIPVVMMIGACVREQVGNWYKLHAAGVLHRSLNDEKFKNYLKATIEYWSGAALLPNHNFS